jgi:hypothetical protein
MRDRRDGQFRPRARKKEIVMKTHDIHRYRMLVRVREFGAAHRDRFAAASPAGQLFAAVSRAVEQLSTYVGSQANGQNAWRGGATSKAAAREALSRALDAVARTARVLDVPALSKFCVPSARNDHELAVAAGNFLRDLVPFKAQFVAYGLPKSFLADLQATLDAFERATQDRLAGRETSAAAAAGINTAMDGALAALARLDAIVANTMGEEPTLLAAWTAARRVTRVRAGAQREPAAVPDAAPVPLPVKTPETGQAA